MDRKPPLSSWKGGFTPYKVFTEPNQRPLLIMLAVSNKINLSRSKQHFNPTRKYINIECVTGFMFHLEVKVGGGGGGWKETYN